MHPGRLLLLLWLQGIVCCGCARVDLEKLAEASARSGDYKTAIALYDRVAPTTFDPSVFGNRGNCYSYLGDLDAALADYDLAEKMILVQSAHRDDPRLAMNYFNRGVAYLRAEKYPDAIENFEKTISLNRDYPEVTNVLAWTLATCPELEVRNGKRAVELAESELRKFTDSPHILDTLAAAYATSGDFDRAIETEEKAISKCEPDRKADYSARLELYRSKQIFIDDPKSS